METNLAVLIDFENIAAGTEKEGLGRFDVEALFERLKDKGRILVARSYADWGRFARFKQMLLTSNVTMMELTSHGMQDKNRADIALVVDCLELAFTRDYIDTFVVVSGDSDFTPLVLKMRELNKRVIGCGTRSSTSRLLIQACDEFLFYDSLVKPKRSRQPARDRGVEQAPGIDRSTAFEILADALAGLLREDPDPPLASVAKGAMLRKQPDFNEADLGFNSFARFLESAQAAGRIRVIRDRKSGGYRVDSPDSPAPPPMSDDNGGPGPRRAPAGAEAWLDPYLPDGTREWVVSLTNEGLNPLSAPTRKAILETIFDAVKEREDKKRRVNVQFVQEDVRRRMKRTHPDLPARAIRAVFNALMRAGVLLHRDGSPVRTASANFTLSKDVEGLERAVVDVYLDTLNQSGSDLSHVELLAALFYGDAERNREVEETLAWLHTPAEEEDDDDDDDDDDDVPPPADIGDLDALLSFDDPEPEEASEPVAPSTMEEAVESEPGAERPVLTEEAERKPRRKRVRRRKTDDEGAVLEDAPAKATEGDTSEILDALLTFD